ncbi:alpha-amylase [Ranunculus cassubicifolius]
MFVAEQVFDEMSHRDVVAWNSLICGYAYNGYDLEAFRAFLDMLEEGLCPCPVTMVSVIPACAKMGCVYQGKSIHGFGVKIALDLDSRVENALTAMYAKCGDVNASELLFEGMLEKSVVSWNTMISAYGQNGYYCEAFLVFKRMCAENVGANSITVVSFISTGAPLDSVHSYAIKIGVDSDDTVHTSLVCTYARLGKTKLAHKLYESMYCRKNLVSLTAIMSSYAEKGDMASALKCFSQIQVENMKPDAVTIVTILHGCTNYICNSRVGIGLHGHTIKSGLASNTLVINGLISMYGKLKDVDAAALLFLGLDERPLISWNSMISIYVQVGKLNDAMDLCCQMKMSGSSPDTITVASILSGCSQLSLLHVGKSLHSFVLRNNLKVDDFVGTAFIDMYAKCGSIENAERVFKEINAPCLPAWNAMISGYGMCGLEQKAIGNFSEMVRIGIKPDEITFLAVLSACSHTGLVEDGLKYFRMMNEIFGLEPGAQHCACMVDLFSRAGLLDEAFIFVHNMKAEPDSVVLLALLGACYMHKEVKLAEYVAKKIFLLDQRNSGVYVLMSNLYATAERWNDVAKVRNMKSDTGDDGFSGTSLIEVGEISFKK